MGKNLHMNKNISDIVAIAVAIVTIVATIFITYVFKDRKELHITLDVSENTNISARIRNEIEFDTHSTNIFIVKNNGDIDICENDFLEPIIIEFNAYKYKHKFLSFYDIDEIKEITIFNMLITNKDGSINYDIKNDIAIENNCVIIKKFTLLSNEEFKITLISDYMITNYKVEARILGINKFKKTVIVNGSLLYFIVFGCSLFLILIMIPFFKNKSIGKFAFMIVLIVLCITAFILALVASLR